MNGDRRVNYLELEELGFVNPSSGRAYSRKHLIDMMRRGQWPRATQISPNRIAWRLSELQRHFATLPVAKSVSSAVDVS
jgi:predicted DNA-binding transcriptional regulator AlpA